MRDYYLYHNDIEPKAVSDKEVKEDLLRSIRSAKVELEVAHENYNYASEELIDYYSYQIKAAQAKFDYLLRKVKKMSLENRGNVG